MIPHSKPWITQHDVDAATDVLRSGLLSRGEILKKTESELAEYLGKKYALFTGNGTQAQMLLLHSLGVGEGDEVIMPSYVCDKVYKGIKAVGATPVLCDINEDWVMDHSAIEPLITSKTKAIILVHIFGINAWTQETGNLGIPVIEDICQSFGNIDATQRTGSFTNMAFTSFHGTKNIAAGEGGMLFLNDENAYQKILNYKKHSGIITSATELAGSLVLSQFMRIETNLKNRNEIADRYNRELPEKLNSDAVSVSSNSMNFRYVLRTEKEFENIRQHYLAHGIHVRKGVDSLVHRDLNLPDAGFDHTVELFNSSVSIPILPSMSAEETDLIIRVTNELYLDGIL